MSRALSADLRGVFPVLPTPFGDDGALDTDSLNRLLEHALHWRCHGIAVLGVASEVEKLRPEEYEVVAELALRKIDGRVPVIMGVSAPDPQIAARQAALARRVGAAVVFAKSPPPGTPQAAEAELVRYFTAIAEAADLPVMVQNFAPADAAGGVLSPESLRRLADAEPRIRYVKEETPPPAGNGKLTQLKRALGDQLVLFSGSGGITLPEDLRRGARGTMPGAVLVPALVRIYQLFREGREPEADALHATILPLILFRARWGSVTVTKTILHERGVLHSAHVRTPLDGCLDEHARWELQRLTGALAEHL
jgi:4-hydroxy-tetrahydrodipicolinate synthase